MSASLKKIEYRDGVLKEITYTEQSSKTLSTRDVVSGILEENGVASDVVDLVIKQLVRQEIID